MKEYTWAPGSKSVRVKLPDGREDLFKFGTPDEAGQFLVHIGLEQLGWKVASNGDTEVRAAWVERVGGSAQIEVIFQNDTARRLLVEVSAPVSPAKVTAVAAAIELISKVFPDVGEVHVVMGLRLLPSLTDFDRTRELYALDFERERQRDLRTPVG